MARHPATPVAQVDVRIGETTLERFCVRAGEQLWIGSQPGADLAVAGIGAFPLLTGNANGFVVRPSIADEAAPSETRLAPGDVVTLRFGLATVELRLAVLPRTPVPRPPVNPRPAIYTVLSLLAHLCIWGAAARVPLPAPPHHRVLARLVHHAHEPRPVPQEIPHPVPAQPSKSPERPAHRMAPRPTEADAPPPDIAAAFAAVAKAIPDVDWDAEFRGTGDIYRPDEAPGFGQHLASGGFGTVPSGPWAAIASGNPLMYCVTDCRTSGPIDLMKLSGDLEGAWTALTKCDYARGPAILTFTIGADGHVGRVGTEGGTGAGCAAKIIASNQFREMAGPTDVTLSLGYK